MMSTLAVFLQNNGNNVLGALFGGMALLFWLAVAVVVIIGGWKVFEKAGHPGWAILIPFYNTYIMLKIAGRPGWWLLLYLIPIVNLVIARTVDYRVIGITRQRPETQRPAREVGRGMAAHGNIA